MVRRLDRKYKFYLAVDNRHLFPHISLLHLKASPKKLKEIILAVGAIGKKHKKIKLKFTAPWHGKLFLVLGNSKPKQLFSLHKEVVEKISVLRSGITNLGLQDRIGKAYFKKFGVANVLKRFRPHITIGHIRKRYLKSILSDISNHPLPDFVADRLAIARVNKHHQVFKIIKEFKLA